MDFDVFRAFVGLMVVLVAALIVLGIVCARTRREKPLQTAVTFMLQDGQMLTLQFDRRGHLKRTVFWDPINTSGSDR